MTNEEQTLTDIESVIGMWRAGILSPSHALVEVETQLEIGKEESRELERPDSEAG